MPLKRKETDPKRKKARPKLEKREYIRLNWTNLTNTMFIKISRAESSFFVTKRLQQKSLIMRALGYFYAKIRMNIGRVRKIEHAKLVLPSHE